MNRESYDYSKIENVTMNRSTFRRLVRRYGSTSQGYLTPFFVKEMLPGDTMDSDLAGTIRQVVAPKFPVMDHVICDVFAFMVPNRLTWEHWKEFMGPENNVSAWASNTVYKVPGISPTGDGDENSYDPYGFAHVGSLWDKLNLPVYTGSAGYGPNVDAGFRVNALPFRAYKLIWNEFFRSEALQDPVLVNMTDTASIGDYTADSDEDMTKRHYLLRACKMHDRFTSALPAAQFGAPVSLFSDLLLPVYGGPDHPIQSPTNASLDKGIHLGASSNVFNIGSTYNLAGKAYTQKDLYADATTAQAIAEGTPAWVFARNLYGSMGDSGRLDYDGNLIPAHLTVNDFRASFAIQRIREKDARSGVRYTEMLRSHFSVTSPDARLQRPEYLGGMSFDLDVNQVVQVSQTSDNKLLGSTGAYSKTSVREDGIVHRNMVEHGFLFFLCVFRVKHTYSQGIMPMWTREDREDYYFPALAHLGEQPIYKRELYFKWNSSDPSADNNAVFGFQECYQDYRDDMDQVSGILRPELNNGFESWTYGDVYASTPSLSADWIAEPSSNVQRSLIDQSSEADQFIYDFTFRNATTRVMPQNGTPGLIDHF